MEGCEPAIARVIARYHERCAGGLICITDSLRAEIARETLAVHEGCGCPVRDHDPVEGA